MKEIYSLQTKSLNDLSAVVVDIRKILPRGAMVLLDGDLGAGKTTFVRYFCESLSIQLIQSPTYSIHQRYSNTEFIVDHFDLYRLETHEQIESAGIFDLLYLSADYSFIEWSNRIPQEEYPKHKQKFYLVIRDYHYSLFL